MRYMHRNRICAMQMSDSGFMNFIDGLNVGRNPDGSPLRDPNRIRAIGSTCLDFLNYMGYFITGQTSSLPKVQSEVTRSIKFQHSRKRERVVFVGIIFIFQILGQIITGTPLEIYR